MADAAIAFLLRTLKELVVYEINLSREAESVLSNLERNLELMKAVLEDAADKKSKAKALKTWEKQIREVVYDAEDLIDSWICLELAGKTRSNLKRINIAEEVKKLQVRIDPIFSSAKKDLALLPVIDEADARTKRARQVEPLFEKTVVGFEDAIESLIKDLCEPSSQVEAISIIGMPGLGKTTVASKIFRDSGIDYDFPTRIWVNVSEDYKARDIYLMILKKFTSQDLSGMSDSELALKARGHLSEVKFLLVFDDVWDDSAWRDIKAVLPTSEGKVLITSRFDKVATNANPRREPHKLRFLTEEESWKLLQFEVYGKVGVWPADSLGTGRTISKTCDGLPLAIVVIGGILRDKIYPEETRKAEWKEVSERAEQYLMADDKQKEISLRDIIGLSYEKMPYYLRDCFLYFGVYPKDFEISAWKLTRLWIAEGFIKEEINSDKSLEDTAQDNLKELIRRNLVMVGRQNAQGVIKTCLVHDMIREFCRNEASFDQSNFLQVISMSTITGRFFPDVGSIENYRRVGIHSCVSELLAEKPKGPRTRSLLCFSKHEIEGSSNSFQAIRNAFQLLRVFEGSSVKFPKFDIKLTELIHLRYITLAAGENFKMLPACIVHLRNLQTLVIETFHHTFEIAADISSMGKLRHLRTKAAIVLNADKKVFSKEFFSKEFFSKEFFSKESTPNKNLQSLGRLSSQSCKEKVLSKAPKLQTLSICGKLESLIDSKCLKDLRFLKCLKMINVMESDSRVPRFICAKQFPPNLKNLSLSATNLEWHYMSTLGQLRELEALKLKDNAFRGDEWEVVPGQFPCLQYLKIERSDLKRWTIKDGSFPQLTSLLLNNCEKLLDIPVGLPKTLRTLELGVVSKAAADSAEHLKDIIEKAPGYRGGFKLTTAPDTKK